MLMALLMGFPSGLPLLLTSRTLLFWMEEVKVDIKTIGVFSLVSLPYAFKFAWAFLLDHYSPSWLGRRRGWLFLCQIALALLLASVAFLDPKSQTLWLALTCFLISFFSATQDIAVDAYRRETLADNELGLGSSLFVIGYRAAMWVSGAAALILADIMPWKLVYLSMAAIMLLCIPITLWAQEPEVQTNPESSLLQSIYQPIADFFKTRHAVYILLFLLLYKAGDAMAGHLTSPFYLQMGYSKSEIALIAKTLSFFTTTGGALLGGFIILKININRSLWVFGVLQAISTVLFSLLTFSGKSLWALGLVIGFEDVSAGMGTAAFLAFIAKNTDKRFSAFQLALLTSFAMTGRTLFSAVTGVMQSHLGWAGFFFTCGFIALPGLLLLTKVAPWRETTDKKEPFPTI